MKKLLHLLLTLMLSNAIGQTAVEYNFKFDKASSNEAEIEIYFSDIPNDSLLITMSRSSPGRYALHEFVKNVYNVKAFDSKGNLLKTVRPNPYDWIIPAHDGGVKVTYTLFANHADGTYSDISESHAHLNIPATLLYAPELHDREQRLNFSLRDDLNWRVATQLKKENDSTFTAPNLYYLMDSPVEISNHKVKSFTIDSPEWEQTIRFALHDNSSEETFNEYFEEVRKIVLEEIAVFGEAPQYDFGEYTFLACYLPSVHGDGMEHRNSTVVTSTRELETPQGKRNLGTVAHEFFHAWNVERLRPKSLEPFDFKNANMSGELWFAEGFTSYYTNLILKRAGIMDEQGYLQSITPTFNYVWNSPGREYFNPVEMSYQAPFVDAATSVDPVNRGNTFISYYSYGHMLGLALDLELRSIGKSLDGYFSLLWENYGKKHEPYTIEMLERTLGSYAGEELAGEFFNNYIYQSKMPDYNTLFDKFGVTLLREESTPYLGVSIENNTVSGYPVKHSPAYEAGLSKGDQILKINDTEAQSINSAELLKTLQPGETLVMEISRFGKTITKTVTIGKDPSYKIALKDNASGKENERRIEWLEGKR